MINTVAIQGVEGSFHHIVSKEYFEHTVDVIECMTFDRVVECLLKEESDAAVMALENSIVGSIISNYALIDAHQLHIIGEHYLDIQHHLMALPNQNIQEYQGSLFASYGIIAMQRIFQKTPHIKLIEDKDTAEVARRIQQQQLKT